MFHVFVTNFPIAGDILESNGKTDINILFVFRLAVKFVDGAIDKMTMAYFFYG